MRAGWFVGLLAAIGAIAFAVGRWTSPSSSAPHAMTGSASAAASASGTGTSAAPTAPLVLAPPPRAAHPTQPPFTPPPPPSDPTIQELIAGDGEPTDAMIAARDDSIEKWLDDVFGADFPAEKRQAVLDAQHDAARRSGELMWDYYHGYVDKDGSATGLHQIFLIYAHDLQQALTADEYRTLMHLDPGTDSYTAITMPGEQPGDPFVSDAGP